MNFDFNSMTQGEKVASVILAISGCYTIWKGFIQGFYPGEAPLVLGAAVATAGSALYLQRAQRQRKTEQMAREDRERGIE